MDFIKKNWHYILITLIAVAIVAFLLKKDKDDKKVTNPVTNQQTTNQAANAQSNKNEVNGLVITDSIDEELGYTPEDYITLGDYIGISYTPNDTAVNDEQIQEALNEELRNYKVVDRAAQEGDAVDISYKAYIGGKLEENLCIDNYELVIGEQDLDISFDEMSVGKKAGDTFKTTVVDPYYFPMDEEASYEAIEVEFQVTVNAVEEEYFDELTDEWVVENYGEEGMSTADEFVESIKQELKEINEEDELINKQSVIWKTVIDNATMNDYPEILYENIVAIDEADMRYEAEEFWGMTLQEYISENEIDVEEIYLYDVKAELVMWAIAKKENLLVTAAEVEQGYQDMYEDYGCDSVEEMKGLYEAYEIQRALVENNVVNFVCEKAVIE